MSVVSRLSCWGTTPISARADFDSSGRRWPRTSSSPRSAIAWAVSSLIVVDLPGAVGAEQADARALGHVEVEAVDGLDRPVGLGDVAEADGGWHGLRR